MRNIEKLGTASARNVMAYYKEYKEASSITLRQIVADRKQFTSGIEIGAIRPQDWRDFSLILP